MPTKNTHQILVYIPEILFLVLQEGVLAPTPGLSTSEYIRNLIIADFKIRNILTPEVVDSLLTGVPLRVATYAA